jgi:hypothetical protein
MSLKLKYKALFSSSMGRDVLADILTMTHFGCTLNPDNPVQVAEYNVGIAILSRMGVFCGASKEDVIKHLIKSIPNDAQGNT